MFANRAAGSGQEGRALTVADLSKATSNFSEKNIIKLGGSSTMHRGKLKDGSQIAVKCVRKVWNRRTCIFLHCSYFIQHVNCRSTRLVVITTSSSVAAVERSVSNSWTLEGAWDSSEYWASESGEVPRILRAQQWQPYCPRVRQQWLLEGTLGWYASLSLATDYPIDYANFSSPCLLLQYTTMLEIVLLWVLF